METLALSGLGPVGAGISIGVAAAGAGVGMGTLVASAIESMARQPEEAGNIRTTMFIGLGIIEALALYGFLIAFLVMGS